MDPELQQQARIAHQTVLDRVEQAISRLYEAKEKNDHLQIWYAVGALEIYKMQITLLFNALLSGVLLSVEQEELVSEMRASLTEQLDTICQIVRPLLGKTNDDE